MMQAKIMSLQNWEKHSTECDCIWLLKEIQGITHKFEGTRNVFISLDDAWSEYYGYKQGHEQSLHDYFKDFRGLVQVLEHYGAAIGAEGPYQDSIKEQILKDNSKISSEECTKKAVTMAKDKSTAIGFLKWADKKKYGALWSELENNFTRGLDHYPTDLTAAFNLLLNYKPPPSITQGHKVYGTQKTKTLRW